MTRKDRLTEVSAQIGRALGKADKQARWQARKVAEASNVAKEELQEIAKQVELLRKQLVKTSERLKKVLRA
jgi:predicted RNA-binding protein with PUA-like domain